MSQINSITPNFRGTKKTSMGNEYQPSSAHKRQGAGVGFLAGGAFAFYEVQKFKGKKKKSDTFFDNTKAMEGVKVEPRKNGKFEVKLPSREIKEFSKEMDAVTYINKLTYPTKNNETNSLKRLKYRDTSYRRNFIKQLNEIGLSLSSFGKVKERTPIKCGIYGVLGAITLSGMLVGAMIGKVFDSRSNKKIAQAVDEKAQASK